MSSELDKIDKFLQVHHVLCLATSSCDDFSVCNLFYAFDKELHSFVIASSLETQHIKNILQNSSIAGSVVLETKSVGKIQGLQFKGEFIALKNESLKKLYFKKFPYALAMNPDLWQIKINYFKFTDNRLGFGKKIILKI